VRPHPPSPTPPHRATRVLRYLVDRFRSLLDVRVLAPGSFGSCLLAAARGSLGRAAGFLEDWRPPLLGAFGFAPALGSGGEGGFVQVLWLELGMGEDLFVCGFGEFALVL
jgi:hypothetical protein